jgi:inosine-uridine nucleoside N-ribohydrolase
MALYDEAEKAKGQLRILATGPQTNIALVLRKYPGLAKKIAGITFMGGSLHGGNVTQASEFNIYSDPEAAKIVFQSGIPLTMVGLDVTHKFHITRPLYQKLRKVNSIYAETTTRIMDFMFRKYEELYGSGTLPHLHDTIALFALLCPRAFTFERYFMDVECKGEITRGMTVADYSKVCKKAANVNVALNLDCEAFQNWLLSKFCSL